MLRSDPEMFFKYCRMTPGKFDYLLKCVSPLITHSGVCRESVSPGERLSVTLRYLATGNSQQSIAESYRLSKSTVCRIISETCEAIFLTLQDEYLAPPTSGNFAEIKDSFWKKWNFPQCCGAIDGKHCVIQCPAGSGSTYFNYKKSFSLVLLAVCDANYKFTLIDVGSPGRQSDGGVFRNSPICEQLEAGILPPPDFLPNMSGPSEKLPSVIVGDEAFPLRNYLMRPYPGRDLDDEKKIYNYRLSRARRVIENAFGILASRWRIFRRPMILEPEKAISVVKSCIVLHNYLKQTDEANPPNLRYCPASSVDVELSDGTIQDGSWRSAVENDSNLLRFTDGSRSSRSSYAVRERFKDFFVSDAGSVPWQEQSIRRGYSS